MGVYYQAIPKSQIEWIKNQKTFWVATAPLAAEGHVNVSPKGGPYFGIIDEKKFWYMDLTGSGNETISHLYENGRITVLFNAFEGPPRILRLFGEGTVLESETPEFNEFCKKIDVKILPGTRSIIVVRIHQVGSSCGFSVPFYNFKDYRPTLNELLQRKADKIAAGDGKESMPRYWAHKNAWSVDGLPGMKLGQKNAKEEGIAPIKKMVGDFASRNYQLPVGRFTIMHMLLAMLFSALLTFVVVVYGTRIMSGWLSSTQL